MSTVARRSRLGPAAVVGVLALCGCRSSSGERVGGVDLDSSRCEQAYDKLRFCQPEASQLEDRQAFLDACEAMARRGPSTEELEVIGAARGCYDRYTCPSYDLCIEHGGPLSSTFAAMDILTGLGADDDPVTLASFSGSGSDSLDEGLGNAIWACEALSLAGELAAWERRCEQIFEVALANLTTSDNEDACWSLRMYADGLGGGYADRVEVECARIAELRRGRELIEKLGEHIAAGRWSEGMLSCDLMAEPRSKEVQAACRAHASAAYEALTKEVSASLVTPAGPLPGPTPGGETTDIFDLCYDLENAAQELGDEGLEEAEALCKAAKLVPYLTETFAKAEAALALDAEAVEDVLSVCSISERRLEELSSDWANTQRERLFELCVVEAAKLIFPVEIPRMTIICTYDVAKLYEKLVERDHHDPALDPWLEIARPLCGKDGG